MTEEFNPENHNLSVALGLIKGLMDCLRSCRSPACTSPATSSSETAEIGYYVYFCDHHKRADSEELSYASVIRQAEQFVKNQLRRLNAS